MYYDKDYFKFDEVETLDLLNLWDKLNSEYTVKCVNSKTNYWNYDEKAKEYKFEIEMPGTKKSDINCSIDSGNLKISYKNKNDKEFVVSLSIGKEFDTSKITVKYVDGILYISIKKFENPSIKIDIV